MTDALELERIVEHAGRPRVLIVGDLILDRYVSGDVTRISPEAPIPILTAKSALDFGASADLKVKMALVRQFVFDHGLLGSNTKSADDVAIKFPDGTVHGKPDRVRLTFEQSYMQLAAQGKL